MKTTKAERDAMLADLQERGLAPRVGDKMERSGSSALDGVGTVIVESVRLVPSRSAHSDMPTVYVTANKEEYSGSPRRAWSYSRKTGPYSFAHLTTWCPIRARERVEAREKDRLCEKLKTLAETATLDQLRAALATLGDG